MKFKEKVRKGFNYINSLEKKSLSFPVAIMFFLVAAVLLVRFQSFATNGSVLFNKSSLSFEWKPVLIFYNALPFFVVLCFLYFLSGSVNVSFSVTSLTFLVMLVVNFFKIEFRSEPFIPTDITNITEAANVSSGITFKFSFLIVVVIIIALLVNVLMWIFVRSKKTKLVYRLIGLVLSAVIGITSYTHIYSDLNKFKDILTFANVWRDVSVMQNKGFIYNFLTRFKLFGYDEPEGYSEDAVFKVYNENPEEFALPEGYVMPDVIAIMGESFFDTARTNIKFPDGINPNKNIERLREDGLYGDLIVRGIGGGTVISEFEFLTANAISFVTDTIISPYNTYITKNAYSIPRYLKEEFSYKTNAMHLGNEWFYNRKSTYPRLGFDNTLFYEDIEDKNPQKAYNGYTADCELTKLILEKYEEHINTNPENSYFNFNVTVENHLPYNETYANEEYVVRGEGWEDSVYYMINQYVEKALKTDEVLGAVADYMEGLDRPAVVVFYGDHLPNFNQKTNDILPKMGIDVTKSGFEGDMLTHRTPYIIWGNTAYREQLKKFNLPLLSGDNGVISSNYLGIELLKYMNAPMSPHFKFIKGVEEEIPVITPYYYVTKDGEVTDKLSEDLKKKLSEYKIIQYYAISDYKK